MRRLHLLLALALLTILGSFSGVSLSGGPPAGQRGGERGLPPLFVRNIAPETGDMHPRLAEALNALGAGRHDECRRLSEALLEETDDSNVRSEAVALIILSHLDRGRFEAARAAAEELTPVAPDVCRDMLARVKREERDYNAEVNRLQHIVATTDDPAQAARAQLWTAHAHQRAGRLDVAEKSYRKVTDRHPQAAQAPTALTQIALMQCRQGWRAEAEESRWEIIRRFPNSPSATTAIERIAGWRRSQSDEAAVVAACEQAIDLAPDSRMAARSCQLIYLHLLPATPGESEPHSSLAETRSGMTYEAVRQRLHQIAAEYPNTQAGDAARFGIGMLYFAQKMPELAEREWAILVATTTDVELAREARGRLADARYSLATGVAPDDLEKAIRYMRLAADSPEPEGRLRALERLAMWHVREGDLSGARESYLECAHLTDDSGRRARLLHGAASCLLSMGMVKEAIAEYQQILRQDGVTELTAQKCRQELAAAEAMLVR